MNTFKIYFSVVGLVLFSVLGSAQKNSFLDLSYDLLTSKSMNQPYAEEEKQLAQLPFDSLVSQLDTDQKKKAFWMNIYRAYSQKIMAEQKLQECDKACKKAKSITIGQRVFSLNQILYGILLHSKSKVYQGTKLVAPKWEKSLRVSHPDGRILLALYSDPELQDLHTYFDANQLSEQLNTSSTLFLKKYVYYKVDANVVYLPKWLKYFKRDFGKTSGIIGGLKLAGVVDEGMKPKLVFDDKLAISND